MISHATLLYLSAILTGIERGGIPGLAPVAVTTLVATSGSAALSRRLIGLLLPVYCASDLFACYTYKESIRWDVLRNLVLPVAVGMFFSFLTLGMIDAEDVRAYVGVALAVLLSVLSIMTIFLSRNKEMLPTAVTSPPPVRVRSKGNISAADREDEDGNDKTSSLSMALQNISRPLMAMGSFQALVGFLAGYLTVIASVGGLLFIIFLMAMNLPARSFNGTRSALLLICNGCKMPGQMLLGAIQMTVADLVLIVPLVLASVVCSYATEKYIVTPRLSQTAFEHVTWLLLAFSAVKLMFVF